MDEARKQTEALFEALYKQHYASLLRRGKAYFGFQERYFHLAENAVQETFAIAFESRERFLTHSNQAAWLVVVLKRQLFLCMQEILTSRDRLIRLEEEALPPQGQIEQADALETFLEIEDNHELVERMMKTLNKKEKRLVRMFYFEEKSSKEIAFAFHTTERVVNVQLFRIRKKMREACERDNSSHMKELLKK